MHHTLISCRRVRPRKKSPQNELYLCFVSWAISFYVYNNWSKYVVACTFWHSNLCDTKLIRSCSSGSCWLTSALHLAASVSLAPAAELAAAGTAFTLEQLGGSQLTSFHGICIPGHLLCRSTGKTNSLLSIQPCPFTSSQLHLSLLPFVLLLWFAIVVCLCFPQLFLSCPKKTVMFSCLLTPPSFYQWIYVQCKALGAKAVRSFCTATTQRSLSNLNPLCVA